MEDNIVRQLLLQLLLILLNAFFAATEIALISLNEKKVKAQAEDGNAKAEKMLTIIKEPTRFLSTIQIGITLAGFLGSAFAADNFSDKLTVAMMRAFNIAEVHQGRVDTISVILVTLILSYFTLVLGELVPKRVAMKHKEKLAGAVCGIMSFLTFVLRPVVWFLTISTNGILRLFGINPNEKEESVSEEDIVIMLDAGADDGTLKQDDIEYIKNVFKLERLSAQDIMTPRSAVVAVPDDIETEELLGIIETEGYSRIPVYQGNFDKVIGILHVNEYLLKRDRLDFKWEDAMLDPDFVPETIHLDVLFKKMQKEHTHMAVVVNEYGLTAGIITMEDIIEELVGEIWDEQDEAIEPILSTGEDIYRVLTGVSIDEFFDFFSLDKNEEIESSTVNGWLSEYFGSIPEVGAEMTYENLQFTVTQADEQMTHEVSVVVLPDEEEKEEEKEDE
ncbi:MAG: HlyC/CorC family transporter [Clostridia bacterium]|nr:HlyC/CorC family transporter [Clostridia bacterium]